MIRIIFAILASCTATACASHSALAEKPAQSRDLAAFGKRLVQAGIADTSPFQPQLKIEGCSAGPLPSKITTPEVKAALTVVQEYSDAHKGTGLIVIHDGAIIHERYTAPGARDTATNSFQMHQSLVALVIGAAIDRGILSGVDVPVGQYLPEWAGDARGDIPLERFMRMESGLYVYKMADGDNKFQEMNLGEYIDAAALANPLADPPTTVFRMNNADAQIAGIVLERALKRNGYDSYASFLRETIWCPIGASEGALWLDREGGGPRYFAGLFTPLRNWARIGELVRSRGMVGEQQVISSDWLRKMASGSTANPNYGLSIWLGSPWVKQRYYGHENPTFFAHSEPYLASDVVFFDGFGGQRVYAIPSKKLTIVRTGNVDVTYDDAFVVNSLLAEF